MATKILLAMAVVAVVAAGIGGCPLKFEPRYESKWNGGNNRYHSSQMRFERTL